MEEKYKTSRRKLIMEKKSGNIDTEVNECRAKSISSRRNL